MTQHSEAIPFDLVGELSIDELSECCGLSLDELHALVDAGVLVALDQRAARPTFPAEYITVTRLAFRLRDDFELDTQGLALALTLLTRISQLELQARRLEALIPVWPILRNSLNA